MQKLSKFIFTRILGWKLVGDFPKHLKKYLVKDSGMFWA